MLGIDTSYNAVIGFPRQTDNFTYSGGDFEAAYPATNAQNITYARVARSESLSASPSPQVFLQGTSATTRIVRMFGIAAHNMRPATSPTFRLRLYSDAAYTTEIYDSGVENIWPPPYTYAGRSWYTPFFWIGGYSNEEIGGQIPFRPIYLDQAYAVKSWRIDFYDENNTDDYIQVGLFEVAAALTLPVNFGYGSQYGYKHITKTVELDGGLKRFDVYDPSYVFDGRVEYMPEEQAQNNFMELFRQHGLSVPFMWLPFPLRPTTWLRTSKMVNLADPGLFAHAEYGYDSVPLRLEEYKG